MLAVRGVTKSFGGTLALNAVDLQVESGEVHAIVGENGAGKSTLMKLLAGALQPNAGRITLDGQPHCPENPAEARRAGVALVTQEAELAPHLSVAENIILGREPTRHGMVRWRVLRARAAQALAQVTTEGPAIDLGQRASELSPSERQRVAIARALSQTDLRLLIFDEPTSSLAAADVKQLFAVIARLKQRGIAILYVSHFLEEVVTIADRYSVLRDGHSVGTGLIANTTSSDLVTLMAGGAVVDRKRRIAKQRGAVMLQVRALAGLRMPREASFDLHAGEVLGIAGLVGAGRTELLRVIYGLDKVRSGTLRVRNIQGKSSPAQSLAKGLGLLSEDRRGEGLAHALGIAQNITLSKLLGWGPIVTSSQQRASAQPLIERLGIRCRDADQSASELSGGNQQKVALARLLHHDVDVLLLDEPTRGIDVRSRGDVHRCIDELVARGKAVLVVSSYLPELLTLCDRIAVMCRGKLGESRPVSEWDEHSLLMEATGAS